MPFSSNIFLPSDSSKAITLPVSKSIGARYLAASFFAGAIRSCRRFTDCDDLRVIQQALLDLLPDKKCPDSGIPFLDIHASGTAFRFVTAVAASTPGADFIVTGTPRLCKRPMAPMLDVLRLAGASIESKGENHTGPYRVTGRRLKGGEFNIRGDVSSQFISALMLAAPTWQNGMALHFTTPLVSRPYAEMTAEVMRRFSICVDLRKDGVTVEPGGYIAPENFRVEADWSAAGFFYEAVSMMPGHIYIRDLANPHGSLQGDAATAVFFEKLGVISDFGKEGGSIVRRNEIPSAIEADLTYNPDLAPAFAVACVMNDVHFLFTGVRNLRLKECDRLAAIHNEFGKLGYLIEVKDDSISWRGKRLSVMNPVIDTYDDHRIAMAFAMAALALGEIRIKDPDVVNKSFEDFWNQLPKLGLNCRREGNLMIVRKEDKTL